MTDTPPHETPPDDTKPSMRDTAMKAAKQAQSSVETAGKITETFGSAISAVKWVAIAVTMGFVFGFGLLAYKIVSAPAKAAANATETVTDVVKSGASSVAEGTSNVLARLVIPSPNQAQTNKYSEAAFARLNAMPQTPAGTLKARTYWAANLAGHDNRVCQLSVDFGAGQIPIFMAADNKGHAGAKSLGSKNDRLMRIIIRAEGNDLPLRVEWEEDASNWVIKWRSTTMKKPLEDPIAATRVHEILRSTDRC